MRIARLFKAFATQAQHVCGHNLTHRSPFSKAHSRFFLVFIIVYLLAWVFLRWRVSHDPGSYFFTVQGYAPKYSLTRVQQAQSYLENIFKTSHNKPISIQHHDNKKVPQLCIGMPTAKRPKEQYVNIAIASLLDHLSAEEREQIQLNILIALANPEEHPFYDSSASIVNVSRLADNVLTYHNVAGGSQIITEVIRDLERAKRYNDKSFYDYALVLHQCSQSQAPWTLILEDDTLAQEGWYTRTMDSLRELDRRKNRDNNQADDWLYLRLFYTEKFLGWNSEAWPTYMFWSLLTIMLTTGIGLYLRRRFSSSFSSLPYTALPSKQSSPVPNPVSLSFIFSVSFLCVPALIILYFAAGRMTVQPLPTGINVMNNFGCCSQALAFPRNVSLKLSDWLEKNITAATANLLSDTLTDNSWTHLPSFAVDSAIEAFANEQNLQRYALVPSAFQHVGAETYKEGRTVAREWFSISGARGIWNFRFEELG